LADWFRSFALPSIVSIAVTFGVLRLCFSKDLDGTLESEVDRVRLSPAGGRAAYGIAGAGIALMAASAMNIDLGLPTFLAAIAAAALVTLKDRDAPVSVVKDISWEILPLVAGLFVLVAAVDQAGALAWSQNAIQAAAKSGPLAGSLYSAFGVALLSNIANNLPVGLIAGSAIHAGTVPAFIKNSLLIGVDLGPNLSVTGSLATILWLVALRRDGEDVSFWTFFRVGLLVMPAALALSIFASLLSGR
jgi:arsenical pump membrane protein